MEQNMLQTEQQSAADGARTLGWGSIGIGLMELVAPHQVEHMLGLEHSHKTHGILRALGVRELLHGVGILAERRATPQLAASVWARVLGDALDSALLGIAATKTKRLSSFAAVAATVTAIGAADLYYAMKIQHQQKNGFLSR
jgi:hypothetical protein